MADRHLARPEALDADLVLQLVEPLDKPVVELRRRDDHRELALQAFGQGLGDLHVTASRLLVQPCRTGVLSVEGRSAISVALAPSTAPHESASSGAGGGT